MEERGTGVQCPRCGGELVAGPRPGEVQCPGCGRVYGVEPGRDLVEDLTLVGLDVILVGFDDE